MGEIPQGIPEKETKRSLQGEKVYQGQIRNRELKEHAAEQIKAIVEKYDELEHRYGPEFRALMQEFFDKKKRDEDVAPIIDRARGLTDYENFGNRAFELFKKKSIISHEFPSGAVVVDVDRLRNFDRREMSLFNKINMGKMEGIYYGLRDRAGISQDDFEKGNYEPRPILDIPANEQAAYDIESIKKRKPVVELWKTVQSLSYEKNPEHPTQTGQPLKMEAFQLANIVYHPSCGDGYRDDKGKLLIRHPKTREYVNATAELIREGYHFYGSGTREKTSFLHDVGKYLHDKVPELEKYGLLRDTDFRTNSSGEFKSERLMRKEVGSRGVVMINGVLHYVGRELEGKAEVVQLSPGLGGVLEADLEGRSQLTKTFRIFTQAELSTQPGSAPYAGADKTGVRNFESENTLPKRPEEDDAAYNERVAPLLNFSEHWKFSQEVNRQTGLKLSDIPLREQIGFSAAAIKYPDRRGELIKFAKEFGADGIKVFSAAEHGLEYAETILNIADNLPEEQAQEIFQLFNKLTDRSSVDSARLAEELGQKYPDTKITPEQIAEAMLSRGRDLLNETNFMIASKRPEKVADLMREIQMQSGKELVMRGEFMKVLNLLGRDNIRLAEYAPEQELNLRNLKESSSLPIYLKAMESLGRLKPIPEIHWRVDRTMEEYDRRFGIHLDGFLAQRAKDRSGHQTLLEIGPGSGTSHHERALTNEGSYDEYALSDSIYYPVSAVLEKVINFEKLKKDGKVLEISEHDRKTLADFLYKSIVIAPDQTELDNFQYDRGNTQKLADDINNLKSILVEQERVFGQVHTVPDTISSRDEHGNVIYPNKISAERQSKTFKKIKQLMGSGRLTEYLIPGWQTKDFHEFIPVFPPNIMIGDIQDIKRLSPGQIDVELASRSTVYAREDNYLEFLKSLSERLADGGIAIDDSIRDNDGWYYRIAEVSAVKQESKDNLEVLVAMGPGFPNEDHRQDRVPLAMFITKKGSSRDELEKQLLPGSQLVALEDLAADEDYLRSLDKTGRTLEQVRQARKESAAA